MLTGWACKVMKGTVNIIMLFSFSRHYLKLFNNPQKFHKYGKMIVMKNAHTTKKEKIWHIMKGVILQDLLMRSKAYKLKIWHWETNEW